MMVVERHVAFWNLLYRGSEGLNLIQRGNRETKSSERLGQHLSAAVQCGDCMVVWGSGEGREYS